MGVPALPDGTRLPVATDRHQRNAVLYGRYADAWRVTDTTTLFDYDAGKTTATYTQKGFPADTADVTFSDLTAENRGADPYRPGKEPWHIKGRTPAIEARRWRDRLRLHHRSAAERCLRL